MKKDDLFTPAQIAEVFRYDALTGEIFWDSGRLAGQRAGTINKAGYVRLVYRGTHFSGHRVAWCLHHGAWPLMQIDHINGDRSDNRIKNLRLADQATNMRNTRMFVTNNSGVCGVCWHKRTGRWRAYIVHNYAQHALGFYEDWFDAVCARKSAENKFGFHKNHGKEIVQTPRLQNCPKRIKVWIWGEELSLKEISGRTGISYFTLYSRFSSGDRGSTLVRKSLGV